MTNPQFLHIQVTSSLAATNTLPPAPANTRCRKAQGHRPVQPPDPFPLLEWQADTPEPHQRGTAWHQGREGRGDPTAVPIVTAGADGKPAGAAPTKPRLGAGGALAFTISYSREVKTGLDFIQPQRHVQFEHSVRSGRRFFCFSRSSPRPSTAKPVPFHKESDRCSEDGMFCAQRHFYREAHPSPRRLLIMDKEAGCVHHPGRLLIMDKETGCVHQPRGPTAAPTELTASYVRALEMQ